MKSKVIKLLTMILFFEIVIITLLSPISSAGYEKFTLSTSKNTVEIGDTIEIELNLSDGMKNQNQLAIILKYDSSKLKIISDAKDSDNMEFLKENESLNNSILTAENGIILGLVNNDSTISLVYYTNSEQSYLKTNAKLAKLKFKAIKSGNAKISFDTIEYAYESDEPTKIESNSELTIKVNEKSLPFTDVDMSKWYLSCITYVYNNGLIKGLDATTFGPNDNISRGQMATILYRLAGSPKNVTVDKNRFADVKDESKYYFTAVMWASENKVVSGYTSGKKAGCFGPSDNITRQELGVMFSNYAKNVLKKDITSNFDLSKFKDYKSIASWAATPMKYIAEKEIITGDMKLGYARILPKNKATRAEASSMIMKFCRNVMKMK